MAICRDVFSANQKVEVKSCRGSWYSASIAAIAENSVRVRYDNVLILEDGTKKVFECFDPFSVFSHVRPRPPSTKPIGSRYPTYGLCVDVNLGKCWYEGVIFDRAEGFEERMVLLFGLDCGIRVQTNCVRVTQAWNSATGAWEERGSWSLIGSYKVREGLEQHISRFEDVARRAIGPTVVDEVCLREDPCIADVYGDAPDPSADLNTPSSCVIPPSISGAETCEASSSNIMQLDLKRHRYWKPAVPTHVPGPKCCPDIIDEYIRLGKKSASESLLLETRQHLLFLGWTIECARYKSSSSCLRFRYTSPDTHQVYLSLRSLCRDLITSLRSNCSPGPVDVNSTEVKKGTRRRSFDVNGQQQDLFSNVKRSKRSKTAREMHLVTEVEPPAPVVISKRACTASDAGSSSELPDHHPQQFLKEASTEATSVKCESLSRKSLDEQSAKPDCLSLVVRSNLKRNPRTVLAWLLDNNVVQEYDKVHYRPNKCHRELTTGRLTREGIICDCCENLWSLSMFEAHAGSKNHRPAANILLEDGRSLMDCQKQLAPVEHSSRELRGKDKLLKTRRKKDKSDDVCSICQCGGDLILCDNCPSAFHQSCIGLGELPPGDWFCFSCCCYVCGRFNFKQDADDTLNDCYQCERKYHSSCLSSSTSDLELQNSQKGHSFCCTTCKDIHVGLKQLRHPIEIGDGSITWTLLKSSRTNSYKLSSLDSVVELMHESFDSMKDAYTGKDIVENIIYGQGSSLKRMNCQGFYTVLLERDGVLVSAATLRVLGDKFAEVPLVATRFNYRRLGMCRLLMGELEKQLAKLGVQRLLLPAATVTLDTWTNQFGFSVLNDRSHYCGFMVLHFHGTVVCEKILIKGNLL